MLWQMSHWLQGVGVGPFSQFSALARIRAAEVLPTPAGAGEQIGMADAIGGDRVRQGLGDVLLADQFGERLRPIAPGDDHVRLRRGRRLQSRSESVAEDMGGSGSGSRSGVCGFNLDLNPEP